MSPFGLKFSQMILHTETGKLMYNWSFLFVVLHKPTLLPSTFESINTMVPLWHGRAPFPKAFLFLTVYSVHTSLAMTVEPRYTEIGYHNKPSYNWGKPILLRLRRVVPSRLIFRAEEGKGPPLKYSWPDLVSKYHICITWMNQNLQRVFLWCCFYADVVMTRFYTWSQCRCYNEVPLYFPTLTKGSKWQITQIWESDVFRLDLAYSTSIPSLKQKHSSCWKIFKSRHHGIALMSVQISDIFCAFTRNAIFKSCFLFDRVRQCTYIIIGLT